MHCAFEMTDRSVRVVVLAEVDADEKRRAARGRRDDVYLSIVLRVRAEPAGEEERGHIEVTREMASRL